VLTQRDDGVFAPFLAISPAFFNRCLDARDHDLTRALSFATTTMPSSEVPPLRFGTLDLDPDESAHGAFATGTAACIAFPRIRTSRAVIGERKCTRGT